MADFPRSPCPIASTLDILGDKWTLLILRDLINGKRRYGEFLESPERISTNILADRLKTLEKAQIIEKRRYSERPVRYEYSLTEKGEALLPVLREICRWANRFIPGTWMPPTAFMERRL